MKGLNFKRTNLRWLKLYWSKIIISFCTIFIVSAVSYTVYNYLTPISNAEVNSENSSKSDFSGEFVDYNKEDESKKDTVEPFSLSEEDVKVSQNENNINSSEKNTVSENSEDKNKAKIPLENNQTTNENTVNYTVQKGDTLFSISRKYMPYKNTKEAINLIKDSNGLKDEYTIKQGQILSIPTYNSEVADNPNISESIDTLNYRVKYGDTLFSIAKNYMTWCDPKEGVSEIIELNKIQDASLIKEGSSLVIPCNSGE
ncbi:LysM peptidoglycan-binding domain-containing protein [Haloimpatiens sp. FM7315]|uniref:muramidase family protein n=1 Tax=Haloimpatiens sp. FM7315 TaxID=3298609 RepID=UPI0035A35A02